MFGCSLVVVTEWQIACTLSMVVLGSIPRVIAKHFKFCIVKKQAREREREYI